jgi:hypothetical protein
LKRDAYFDNFHGETGLLGVELPKIETNAIDKNVFYQIYECFM